MEFERYIHLERLGNDEVRGIEFGECWVFPKLDGTNASVWCTDDGRIMCGSRNRELPASLSNPDLAVTTTEDTAKDNQGFAEYIGKYHGRYSKFFQAYPRIRLYGEWLVPHAFQGYRQDAWKRFYIFDASTPNEGQEGEHFIPYSVYEPSLSEFGFDYVIPQCRIINPTYDSLLHELKQNHFLCEDGKGPGEGIVLKNYGFYNQYKRQVWGKLISNEFKEQHTKFHGVAEKTFGKSIEEKIVELFVTEALIDKEFAKIVGEVGGWNSRLIPRLFHTVFHCVVTEEMWEILRKLGNKVTVNFGALQALIIQRIKEVKKELF
jgi:hypothetical protein